jgi:hypothetical protein
MKIGVLVSAVVFPFAVMFAQQKQGPVLPAKVSDVELTDLDKNPTGFSEYGKKHLMIFYVDPDSHKQNADFQAELEANSQAGDPSFQAYAVLNLKDTALPGGIVRSMAERRTKGKLAISLADNNRILSTAWGLGNVNNKFCLLFVTAGGELVYFRAGEFTEQDKADFYAICDKYL